MKRLFVVRPMKDRKEKDITKQFYKDIVNRISKKAKEDEHPIMENQNCLLCTLCAELNIRGEDILPRPVYNPKDIIFSKSDKMISNTKKIKFSTIDDLKGLVVERCYCHVKWAGGSGGHEFLLIPFDETVYVLDAQSNVFSSIDTKKGKYYFDDIDFDESYIMPIEHAKIDMTYNDEKYFKDITLAEIEELEREN